MDVGHIVYTAIWVVLCETKVVCCVLCVLKRNIMTLQTYYILYNSTVEMGWCLVYYKDLINMFSLWRQTHPAAESL